MEKLRRDVRRKLKGEKLESKEEVRVSYGETQRLNLYIRREREKKLESEAEKRVGYGETQREI